jgi:hypothetical protein
MWEQENKDLLAPLDLPEVVLVNKALPDLLAPLDLEDHRENKDPLGLQDLQLEIFVLELRLHTNQDFW